MVTLVAGHGVGRDAHQPFGDLGVERPGILGIGAQQMLALGEETGFHGGDAAALDEQPGLDPALPANEGGEVGAGHIVTDDGDEGGRGADRR